jgi:hypothetical protein
LPLGSFRNHRSTSWKALKTAQLAIETMREEVEPTSRRGPEPVVNLEVLTISWPHRTGAFP